MCLDGWWLEIVVEVIVEEGVHTVNVCALGLDFDLVIVDSDVQILPFYTRQISAQLIRVVLGMEEKERKEMKSTA